MVLLHAGIADSRMWEGQRAAFESAHTVVRFDARGFGRSADATRPFRPIDDVTMVLDAVGIDRAALVGVSFGAMTAIDVAITNPERVVAVVAAGMGAAGQVSPSDEVQTCWDACGALWEAGDIDGACEVEIRAWVDGPFRASQDVDPAVRSLAYEMNRALLGRSSDEDLAIPLEPLAGLRVEQIVCPLLAITGLLDQPYAVASSRALAASVRGAQLVEIADAAHLVNMERPGAFNAAALAFLRPRVS